MSLNTFKTTSLGSINEKNKEKSKTIRNAILSIILFIVIYMLSVRFLLQRLNLMLIVVLLVVTFIIWVVYWTRTLSKIENFFLTNKEKTLLHLYYAIDYLMKYKQNRDTTDFKISYRRLSDAIRTFSGLYFNTFGTKWELDANSFFDEVKLYLDIEILPKLKMSATEEKLGELIEQLEKIFSAFYSDNYELLKKELKEINAKYQKQHRSFWEKLRIDNKAVVGIFVACILIILTFLAYWGVSKWFKIEFSAVGGATISLMITAAIYYGIKIVREVKRK